MGNKTEAEWQTLIAEYKAAGCTQAEFCRRTGLNEHQLSYWKIKLAKVAKPKNEQAAFMQIKVEAPPPKREISIALTNGIKILVPESLKSEIVKLVLTISGGQHV